MIFKTGDSVLATYEGRTIRAEVVLASPNGRSIMLRWDDGMLGGHVGMMPVYQEQNGRYYSLMEGLEILLVKIISTDDCAKADFVVCMREGAPSPFTDNETGVCAHCGHSIIFRPYMPKEPQKICLQCAGDLAGATRQ